MGSYYQFQRYVDCENVTFDQLTLVADYVCGNLNTPSFIFPYWFDMYTYTSKTFQVIALRKRKGEEAVAQLGEAVCTGGKIVNFIKDKQHSGCHCAHVFYKAIF